MNAGKNKTNTHKIVEGRKLPSRIDRPLLWFTVPAAAALLLVNLLPIWVGVVLTLLSVGALLAFRRSKGAFLIFLGATAGCVWFLLYAAGVGIQSVPLVGKTVPFSATVTDYSYDVSYHSAVDVRLDTYYRLSLPARLYLDVEEPLEPGDHLTGTASFTSGMESTGGYSSYASQGIFLIGSVRDELKFEKGSSGIRFFPQRLRHAVRMRIQELFLGDCAGLLMAFLAGDRSGVSDGLDADLRRTGLSHLVAVSGLHVMFLVSLILFVTLNNRWCRLLCIPLLVLFALATGCTPSAMRAVLMECIILLAPFLNREEDGLCALAATFIVLMVVNPYAVTSVSLQLSFASMLGIVLFSTGLHRWCREKIPAIPFLPLQMLSWFVQSSVCMTISASVFTLLLSAYYFGTISIISVLSNLLVVSAASWLFFVGAVTMMVSLFSMAVASALTGPVNLLALYAIKTTGMLASIPFAQLNTGYLRVRYWLLMAGLLLLFTAASGWLRRHWYVPLALAVALLGGTVYSLQTSIIDADIVVQVLNVGQGQSVLVYSGGEAVAVDCGGNRENAGDILAEGLADLRVPQLRALMLTHYDNDHINGVEELLSRVPVKELILPNVEDDYQSRERIAALAAETKTPIRWITEDDTLSFGETQMSIYAPLSVDSDNEACLSACFSSGNADVLITGDMGAAEEEQLAAQKHLKNIEVLVVAHHGSRYSTSTDFLRMIDPDYAVISVGNNRYGHPTEETLQRLREAGCKILRTDENGTVTLRFQEE